MAETNSPNFPNTSPAPPSNFGSERSFEEGRTETEEAADKLKGSAAGAMTDLKDLASAATGDAKSYAGAVASDAATAFKDAVEANKTAGADAVAHLARSAKGAADNIEQQAPQVAGFVRSAADGVERISTDIRDRSVGELMDSVSDFAKRQPAAFFGCGILAGVVLARLLRASDR
jgi:hypothetical protein